MILHIVKSRFKAFLIAAILGGVSYGFILDLFFGDLGAQTPENFVQEVSSTAKGAVESLATSVTDSSDAFPISSPIQIETYDRAEFGSWIDLDGDCQNTRHEILIQQSLSNLLLSNNGCFVKGGDWIDPYSGKRFQDPTQLDIDHIVSLKWAHGAGAYKWSDNRKQMFANDPQNLLAVSAKLNRQKGADAPSDWMPPNQAFRCEYVIRFYKVARLYELLGPEAAIALRKLKTRECS